MRQTIVALALTAAVAGWASPTALAQSAKAKTARGTVTAMAADSVTVKVANVDMTFTVDGKTEVVAAGAGTKGREAQKAGASGPKLADVVKVGQPVQVTYRDMGGTLHAARIRAMLTAGPDPAAPGTKSSNGTVQSVSATSLTISGSSGGGATFTQSFAIDSRTKVVGKGAGTAAAAKGGKIAITDLVANGDSVSVSYSEAGTTLHASEVRVMMKGAGK